MSLLGPRIKWLEQARIDSGATQIEFGRAVAIDLDTVAIAALNKDLSSSGDNTGIVHIYTCLNSWSWQDRLLIPSNGLSRYSYFGSSIAIDGNSVAIAADTLQQNDCYTPLFIFNLVETTWQLTAQLQLPSPPATPIFYQSVALDGDTVVASTKGTVYIFRRHPQTQAWNYETQLQSPQSDFYFGDTVAIEGETIVVSGGDTGFPWAYVFVRNSVTGTWSLQAQLTPVERSLGCSHVVAIAGNTIVIGAPSENRQQGAVYVFERHPTTGWLQQARLVPGDVPPRFAYGFGGSVAICDRTIVVGTSTKTQIDISLPVWNRGNVYVFTRHQRTGQWSQQAQLQPQDYERVAPNYGTDVAISGQLAVVAARNNSAVYIFKRLNS